MDLNVDAQFHLAREVGKRTMIPRRSGKIVNIASTAGLYGNPPEWAMHTIAYNTSKGALIAMTRTLAAEWGKYDINVNAICPGFFASKMTKVTLQRIDRSVLALTPLGRLGGDEDLKGCVVFLASEASRHMTGQALVVDGGCTVV
jgi:gluconate 5-dehydrogenase